MSDAAYFSAFSEPPLETYARRLKSIDRKRKKRDRTEKEREQEESGWVGGGEGEKNRKASFIIPLGKTHLDTLY